VFVCGAVSSAFAQQPAPMSMHSADTPWFTAIRNVPEGVNSTQRRRRHHVLETWGPIKRVCVRREALLIQPKLGAASQLSCCLCCATCIHSSVRLVADQHIFVSSSGSPFMFSRWAQSE